MSDMDNNLHPNSPRVLDPASRHLGELCFCQIDDNPNLYLMQDVKTSMYAVTERVGLLKVKQSGAALCCKSCRWWCQSLADVVQLPAFTVSLDAGCGRSTQPSSSQESEGYCLRVHHVALS